MSQQPSRNDSSSPSPPPTIFVHPIPSFARRMSPNPPGHLPDRVGLLETTVKELRDWKRNDSINGRDTATVAFQRATDAQYTVHKLETQLQSLTDRVRELERAIISLQTANTQTPQTRYACNDRTPTVDAPSQTTQSLLAPPYSFQMKLSELVTPY